MKILVIGDTGIDEFQYGKCFRISPEAPVPILNPTKLVKTLGMAGNVYKNIEKLYNGEVRHIKNSDPPTKTRYVDSVSNQMLLRVDSNDFIHRIDNLDFLNDEKWEAIVISDYDKGFLLEEDIEAIAKYGAEKNIYTFLDTKKIYGDWAKNIDFIKINEKEYFANEGHIDSFENHLIVTLGNRGARHFDKHLKSSFLYELEDKAEVRDLSGAGDTFLAGFVVNYVYTNDIASAIRFANKCASYVVTQKGVVVVDPSKID